MEFIKRNIIKSTSTTNNKGGGSYTESEQINVDSSKWVYYENTDVIAPKDDKAVVIDNLTVDDYFYADSANIADLLTTTGLEANNASIDYIWSSRADIEKLESNNATIGNLTVTGTAHFFELVLDKVRSVGGQMILSPTHVKIDKVENGQLGSLEVFRLFFKASDGEKTITNDFQSGDLIICQTFNAAEGTSYNVSNKFYWARVVAVSTTPNEDGYYNISLRRSGDSLANDGTWSATNCNGIPEAGDEIVVLGSATDTSRQNAIIINSVDSEFLIPKYNGQTIKSPSIVTYKGINTYSLDNKQDTILSADMNVFKGKLLSAFGDDIEQLINDNQLWTMDEIDELTSIINQTNSKLELYVMTDDLETAGIHIDGEESSIKMVANQFNLTNVDGDSVMSADKDGNLSVYGEINASSGSIGGGKIQNNQLVDMNQIVQKYGNVNITTATSRLNDFTDITKNKFNILSSSVTTDCYLPTYTELTERFKIDASGDIIAPLGFKLYAARVNRTYNGTNAGILSKTAINKRSDFVNFYNINKSIGGAASEGIYTIMLMLCPDIESKAWGFTNGFYPKQSMINAMFNKNLSDEDITSFCMAWSRRNYRETLDENWIDAIRQVKEDYTPVYEIPFSNSYDNEIRCTNIDKTSYEGKVIHTNWYKGLSSTLTSINYYTKRNLGWKFNYSQTSASTLDEYFASCGIWCETSEGRYDITPSMFDYILLTTRLNLRIKNRFDDWITFNTDKFTLPSSISDETCFECTIIARGGTERINLYSDAGGSKIINNDGGTDTSVGITQGDVFNFLVTFENNVANYYTIGRHQ